MDMSDFVNIIKCLINSDKSKEDIDNEVNDILTDIYCEGYEDAICKVIR